MSCRILFAFFALICCSLPAVSQSGGFLPVKQDSIWLAAVFANYQTQYKQELTQLPSANRKDYQELYADRWKNIKSTFDAQEIYTSPYAQAYLDALAATIVKANPALAAHPFHCYFSRSYIPNAEYMGEGIIMINMGLFYQLHDESEAAFTLCHEIAHYLLRHQQNGMDKYVTTINSPETQAALRKIKYAEYHKREALESLVKGLTFDNRRHSRDHEAQADSMGVELMRHTGYDLHGALTTLALLDGIDKEDFDTEVFLQKTFNASGYPWKKKWLNQEGGLLGGHARLQEEEMSDSLKTHPSCKLRIALLAPLVGGQEGQRYVVDSMKFATLQEQFRYEVIEYAYVSETYSESLFLTLQLLRSRPSDTYLVANTGRLLNGLYNAQKKHRLSKVADLPSPVYASNYNLLLQFIQNLYLEDLASISYYYLSSWHPQLDGTALFKSAYEESARIVKE